MEVELCCGNIETFDFIPPVIWTQQGGEFLTAHATGLAGNLSSVFVKRYHRNTPAPAAAFLKSLIGCPVVNTPDVYGYAKDAQYEYFFFKQIEAGKTLDDLLANSSISPQYLRSKVFVPEFLYQLVDKIGMSLEWLGNRQWVYTDFCAKNIFITKQEVLLIDLDSALHNSLVSYKSARTDKFSPTYWGVWVHFRLRGPLMSTQLASLVVVLARCLAIVKKGGSSDQAIDKARRLLRSPVFREEQLPLWESLRMRQKAKVLEFWNLPNNSASAAIYERWVALLEGFNSGTVSIASVREAGNNLIHAVSSTSSSVGTRVGGSAAPIAIIPLVPKKNGLSKFIGLVLIGILILLSFKWFFNPKAKLSEALVVAPQGVNTNKRPNDIQAPSINSNNLSRAAEPQDVSHFTVTINSNPSGATVYLDRNRAGITPFSTTLEKGIYGIKIEKEGYRPKIGQIEDGQKDFYVELSPE